MLSTFRPRIPAVAFRFPCVLVPLAQQTSTTSVAAGSFNSISHFTSACPRSSANHHKLRCAGRAFFNFRTTSLSRWMYRSQHTTRPPLSTMRGCLWRAGSPVSRFSSDRPPCKQGAATAHCQLGSHGGWLGNRTPQRRRLRLSFEPFSLSSQPRVQAEQDEESAKWCRVRGPAEATAYFSPLAGLHSRVDAGACLR